MESLLARLPSRSRIAVIRLRSLGDCVLTTPALALLKSYRSDLRIRMVVEPRFAGVFEDDPDVEEVSAEVGRHVDLVLNLHGGTRSMWMTLTSGAKFRAGFGHHRYNWIYSHRIPRAPTTSGRAATSPSTRSILLSPTASPVTWVRSNPANWPISSCGHRPSSP